MKKIVTEKSKNDYLIEIKRLTNYNLKTYNKLIQFRVRELKLVSELLYMAIYNENPLIFNIPKVQQNFHNPESQELINEKEFKDKSNDNPSLWKKILGI